MTEPDLTADPSTDVETADVGRALRVGLEEYELDAGDLALLDAADEGADDAHPAGPLPVLAVVGRPNVGKSTLVNRILGRREAVVQDVPGVTRDRVAYDAQWAGRRFTRSEEHTSELQSRQYLVCRLLLEKKKITH